MNTLGARSLMQTPSLPRITSRTPLDDRDGGESARSMQRGAARQAERPRPSWTAPASLPKQPGCSAPGKGVPRPPGCLATPAGEKSRLPASRAIDPSPAAAKVVEPATFSRLRQGTVVRLAVGDFDIELVLRDSRLYGKVLANSEAAKDLIEGHLDDLRRGLERRGIEIGALEVVVADAPACEAPGIRSVRRLVLDVLA